MENLGSSCTILMLTKIPDGLTACDTSANSFACILPVSHINTDENPKDVTIPQLFLLENQTT